MKINKCLQPHRWLSNLNEILKIHIFYYVRYCNIYFRNVLIVWHFHNFWWILITRAIKKNLENTYNELKSYALVSLWSFKAPAICSL